MKLIRPITVADGGAFSRASPATYWDKNGVMQTAAANTPRLNYDPGDLTRPPAYLFEPSPATNLLTSSTISNGVGVTLTTGLPDPAGGTTAIRLAANGVSGGHYSYINGSGGTVSYVIGTTYCLQAIVTAETARYVQLTPSTTAFAVQYANFDLQAGTIGLAVGVVDAGIVKLSNGHYLIWIACTATVAGPAPAGILVLAPAANSGRLANSAMTESVVASHGMLEVGVKPSSYIAPGSTRAADVNTSGLLSNVPEPDAGDPPAWSATSLVTAGTVVRTPTHEVFKAVLGGPTATVTFTASNANASVNWTNHGLANGATVAFVNTGGGLPAAITAGAAYYVVSAAANTFGLAPSVNGAGLVLATAGTGVHTAQPNPNYGKDPTLPANAGYWVKVGPTNRWAMFDQLSNTITAETDVLATVIDVAERIDTVALLNVSAASARVIVTDADAGVVYDEVHSLVSTDGVDNAWDWCFSPIERVADLTIEDLPPYYSPSVQVILSAPGEAPSCGMCLLGLSYLIGGTQYGAQVGIQDYSVKSTDDFGNIEITARQYAKRGSFSARFPKGRTDSVVKHLTEFRTTPALWLGSGEYRSTAIFGFYKDFSVLIDQLSHSLCEIEIEGLT